MAISLVQQQAGTQDVAGNLVLTFGASFTNGNMIVVGIEENDNVTGPTIAATGVTFTQQDRLRGDASHDNITVWTGVVGAGAGNVVTITPNNTLFPSAAVGGEWSGVQQVVDVAWLNNGNQVGTSIAGVSRTPTLTGDLDVVFCGHTGTAAPTGTPSGYSALTAASSTNSMNCAWAEIADTTAQTPTYTFAASVNALTENGLIKGVAVSGPAAILDFTRGAFPFILGDGFIQGRGRSGIQLDPQAGPVPMGGFERYIFPRLHQVLETGTIFQQAVSGAISPAGNLIKDVLKTIGGAITPAGGLLKDISKPLAGATSPTGTLLKQAQKPFSGSISPTGALALVKVVLLSLAGAISPTGSLAKLILKPLGGAFTPTGALRRSVSKSLLASITPVGSLAKAISRTFAGAISPAGSLVTQILDLSVVIFSRFTNRPSGSSSSSPDDNNFDPPKPHLGG